MCFSNVVRNTQWDDNISCSREMDFFERKYVIKSIEGARLTSVDRKTQVCVGIYALAYSFNVCILLE